MSQKISYKLFCPLVMSCPGSSHCEPPVTTPGIAMPRTSEPFCRLLKRLCSTSSSAPEMGPDLGLGGCRPHMHVFAGKECHFDQLLRNCDRRLVLSDEWNRTAKAESRSLR